MKALDEDNFACGIVVNLQNALNTIDHYDFRLNILGS